MNADILRIWKEIAVFCLKAVFPTFTGIESKNHEITTVGLAGSAGRI
jgi:hypothetical protein